MNRLNLEEQLALTRCPHCKVSNPLLQSLWTTKTKSNLNHRERTWRVYSCSRCGGLVTCSATPIDPEIRQQFPPSETAADPALPDRARAYLIQAVDSLHSPAGAVILAASAVDSMLKARGYKDGVLYSRIEQAVKDHLLTEEMGKWAHEVRLDANDQRHADDNAPLPTEEDAQRVIEFAKALGMVLFVLPAMVAAGRQCTPAPQQQPARPARPPSLSGS